MSRWPTRQLTKLLTLAPGEMKAQRTGENVGRADQHRSLREAEQCARQDRIGGAGQGRDHHAGEAKKHQE